ncbi:uncharacterized protein LOC135544400 isoform X2 [Oncorhynchus masou masou]
MEFRDLTARAGLWYENFMKNADPRTEDWFLMSSPLPQTIIIVAYIYFVTRLGPRLMENRKAFQLKEILIFYNFSVVALSLYMCYEYVMSGWGTGYTFHCDLVDYSDSPQALRVRAVDCDCNLLYSTGRHLQTTSSDGWDMLALLLLKVHRDVGHNLLCSEEEEQSGYVPPCLSSLYHALYLVVWGPVRSRWPGDIPCPVELCGPCHHVLLLRLVCPGPRLPEVPLVEEVPHHHSADPVCDCYHPHLAVLLHEGLSLPVPHLHLHHWPLWPGLPPPLPQLLVPRLHQGQEASQGTSGQNLGPPLQQNQRRNNQREWFPL